MLDKLTSRDRRFILLCVLAFVVFGALGVRLFHRANPEAAIELRVTRDDARPLAENALMRVAGAPATIFHDPDHRWITASRLSTDEEPRVYLERTLGLERANRLYGHQARIWSWDQRWFRSGQKEEWRASITPLGDVIGFEHVLPESAAGATLDEAAARARARRVLVDLGVDPDSFRSIEATTRTLPRRTDWTLVMERIGSSMGDATVRVRVVIAGDLPAGYREFVKVPERWEREYQRLRSANEATGQADSVLLVLTVLAMIAVLVQRTVRRDVPWKLVTSFASVTFVLAFLSQANALPISIFDYETSSPFPGFLTRQVVFTILGALAQGLLIAIIVGAAEPLYRERFTDHLSVRGVFSRRGLRTRPVFLGILLGYAMMAFFLAYQVIFYIVAARFGAWAPADVPYSDLLNTAFPWASVLLIGFLPAVSEEFLSRVFSISFLQRFIRFRWLVLTIPALIWGFGHSTYPNQPFFIRGLEVGLAGIVVGMVFMRWGIVPVLVWHFSVDAGYTALLMLRSGNLYYVISGAVAAGILLVPLGLAWVGYLRHGGFEPEAGLRNADESGVGTLEPELAPADSIAPAAPSPMPMVSPLPARGFAIAAIVAAVLLLVGLIPAHPLDEDWVDTVGKERALATAREFVRAHGGDPDRGRQAIYTATGFAEDRDIEEIHPEETGRFAGFSELAARYVLQQGGASAFRQLAEHRLPLGIWAVRFFRPDSKQESKVLVDAATGRPVQFAFAVEETDSAGPPPSLPAAEQQVRALAGELGYRIHEYAVIDTGIQARPKRVDTRVVMESASAAVGEARPRLTGVFHGDRLAALWPSLRVPEAFVRRQESNGPLHWIALVARLIAGGCLLSTLLFVAIAAIRGGAFRFRSVLAPTLVWMALAALSAIDTWPSLWRLYRTEIPLQIYQVTMVLGVVLRVLFAGVTGLVLFGAIDAASPDWRHALRHRGSWLDAGVRAMVVAAGFLGVHGIAGVLADRFPAAFEVGPGLPASLEAIVPGFEGFMAGAQTCVLWAAGAAAAVLVLRHREFSLPRYRWIAIGLALVLLVPLDARTAGELLGPFTLSALALAWTVVALWILRDHAAAWALLLVYLVVARGAAPLISQHAAADRVQGIITILLGVVAAFALTMGRRETGMQRAAIEDRIAG